MSFGYSSDFVFAFRVKKITVNEKTHQAVMEDMLKGTLLDGEKRKAAVGFDIEEVFDAEPEDLGCIGHVDPDDDEDEAGAGTSKDVVDN